MNWFEAQHQRLRSLFGVFFAPEVTRKILPLARPALRLGGDGPGGTPPDGTEVAGMRLGGVPVLPPDTTWPSWAGRPLDFLGVVDFAALAASYQVPDLPATGMAAFYYASVVPRPWGDDMAQRDGWRVYTGELVEVEPPPATEGYPVRRLTAAPFLSLPAPQEPAVAGLDGIYSGVLDVYEQIYAAWQQHVWPDEPLHQVGGWPALLRWPLGPGQGTAGGERAPSAAGPAAGGSHEPDEEWRLLLQLDSDSHVGWHWGDPGRVYFCNRPAGPAEQCWLALQAR